MAETTKRYAVVTGANKGIGFEMAKQLASKGIVVVLTARDERRGLEAVHKLKESGLSELVVFHQLDVTDPTSVASLADFIKTKFGKLDILVNNAGVIGAKAYSEALKAAMSKTGAQPNWYQLAVETFESSKECLDINYYGVKRVSEALTPLLHLSASPRIVNVSSWYGLLEHLKNEWAKGVLADAENLTEERVEEVLNKYLKDTKEGSLEANGWSPVSAYIVSKSALNAYTRILAKQYPQFYVNSVHPGYVSTDLNFNTGDISSEEGAASPVKIALLPDGGPSGRFYLQMEESAF